MFGDRAALTAAGITEPGLARAYLHSRRLLCTTQGRAYWIATLLAPPAQRVHLWALYGFGRHSDDLVDTGPVPGRRAAFEAWELTVRQALTDGSSPHPVCRALLHTLHACRMDPADTLAQLRAYRRDLSVFRYRSYADFAIHSDDLMCSSGRQLLPLLAGSGPEARHRVEALFRAAHLTDVLQDLADDLADDHLYLPLDDLHTHGVSVEELRHGPATARTRGLIAQQVHRTRALYDEGQSLIPLLPLASRPVIRAMAGLSAAVLDSIERHSYDLWTTGSQVPCVKKVSIVATARFPRRARS